METYPIESYNKGNLRLLPTLERCEPKVQDSTAIMNGESCMRKYFYRIVVGRVPKSSNMQLIWDFGSAYHKFREILEKSNDFKEAYKIILNTKLPVASAKKYEHLNLERLSKICFLAYEHVQKEKAQGKIKVLQTEAPFNVKLEGSDIYFGGRADQIVEWNGKVWGRDFKTTTKEINYFSRGVKPNDQFLRYYVGESLLHTPNGSGFIEGILVEVMQNLPTKSTIHTIPVQFSSYQVNQWIEEQKWFNDHVLKSAREKDIWMMQPHNCGFCDYHSVCANGTNERAIEYKLRNDFIYRPWDFTHVEQIEG